LSLTLRAVGDFGELQVLRCAQDDSVLPASAEPCSSVEELGVGLGIDGHGGAEANEVGDQLGLTADEAELAAELLPGIGHGAGAPLPPPVRETGV
jgi:hypothetical protein